MDEVFGYNKHYIGKLNQVYTNFVPPSLHNGLVNSISGLLKTNDDNRGFRFKMNRLLKAINYDGDFYYDILSLSFQENELKEILKANDYVEDPLSYYKKN
jgi:asparagine synthase (glutamine-hydrolysing)